jgi:Outer membrane protein beta-barrel domain
MSTGRNLDMRKAIVLGVLGLAGTLASPAFADDFSGFRLALNMSSDMLEGDFTVAGVPDTVDKINARRFGYGLTAGWALNKWLAFEGTLLGGSNFNENAFTNVIDPDTYYTSRTNVKGVEGSVVGTAWIGSKFAFFGRLGVLGWKAKEKVEAGFYDDPTSKSTLSVSDNGAEPVYGIGIQTVLDRALIRVEYKRSAIGDLTYTDKGDPTDPNDDFEVYSLKSSDLSSINFSIVWMLR